MAGKIIEISGDTSKVTIPIARFPPFKLRSMLIERDPAAFAHLIDTFIHYFEIVNQDSTLTRLHETSLNQLVDFIGSYIHEMASEVGMLLSLQISDELNASMQNLRAWVFHTIKVCGLFYLRIFGRTLWELVVLYVNKNPESIRSMLDGTFEPQLQGVQNYQLDRINQIQQYLRELVEKNEFKRLDLLTVQYLLRDSTEFAAKFMTVQWIETLEAWWDKGSGKLATLARELMLTTLLTASVNAIVALSKSLNITDLESLVTYPLLGSLLTDDKFLGRRPELINRLNYLNLARDKTTTDFEEELADQQGPSGVDLKEQDLESLGILFPQLSKYQLTQLLLRYDSNVELITNLLFDDPSLADQIPRDAPDVETLQTKASLTNLEPPSETQEDLELHEDFLNRKKNKGLAVDNITKKRVPDEVRNKTLARALELLYENDHDEIDDTYDEAEVERSKTTTKISLRGEEEDDNDEDKSSELDGSIETSSKYDRIEGYLWNLLKEDPNLFARDKRGSKIRKTMRSETGWSDEQIEGWARMLERSPQRARILEEKFMFRGNIRTGKTSYVKNRDKNVANDRKEVEPSLQMGQKARDEGTHSDSFQGKTRNNRLQGGQKQEKHTTKDGDSSKSKSNSKANEKRKHAKNERQKAHKANHNRRAQHDKKMGKAGLP